MSKRDAAWIRRYADLLDGLVAEWLDDLMIEPDGSDHVTLTHCVELLRAAAADAERLVSAEKLIQRTLDYGANGAAYHAMKNVTADELRAWLSDAGAGENDHG